MRGEKEIDSDIIMKLIIGSDAVHNRPKAKVTVTVMLSPSPTTETIDRPRKTKRQIPNVKSDSLLIISTSSLFIRFQYVYDFVFLFFRFFFFFFWKVELFPSICVICCFSFYIQPISSKAWGRYIVAWHSLEINPFASKRTFTRNCWFGSDVCPHSLTVMDTDKKKITHTHF